MRKKIFIFIMSFLGVIVFATACFVDNPTNSGDDSSVSGETSQGNASSEDTGSDNEPSDSSQIIRFKIIYKIDRNKGETIENADQTVVYGEEYCLETPKREGYKFLYWLIDGTNTVVSNGVYEYDGDLTLVA